MEWRFRTNGAPLREPMHAPSIPLRVQSSPLSLIITGLLISLMVGQPLQAASALLESVKQNPALAKSLCAQFKQLNAAGRSATAPDSIAMVASSQGLSQVDAEVLATYVIGLHCPDVR
jgi:hypothetical protein